MVVSENDNKKAVFSLIVENKKWYLILIDTEILY